MPAEAAVTGMLSFCDAACGELAESFTCNVNELVPAAVGVPLMDAPERDRPAGNCPEVTLHE